MLNLKKMRVGYVILSIFTILISAQTANAQKKPMSGVFIGVDAGYLNSNISGFAETFPPLYAAKKRTNFDLSNSAAVVGINLGYGHHWKNDIFTAIELGYSEFLNPIETIVKTTPAHEVTIKYSNRLDLTALIGYDLSNIETLYTRIGVGISDVNISPRDTGGTGGAFHDLHGIVYGVGYSRSFTDNISFNADLKGFTVSDSYNNDKNDGENYDIKMQDIQIAIGVKYNF